MFHLEVAIRDQQKPEILSPAGDWACLRAALNAGCDAVYFGVQGMNMRASAQNFSTEELFGITQLCHAEGVKAYLTCNTVVFEHEKERVSHLLQRAADAAVDAIIASDLAVIEEARRRGLAVHVSTQMSIANSASLLFLHRHLGVNRFVLARECSLDDVKAIRGSLDRALAADGGADAIELEAFVHGAMCVAVSGRCFLSQFQYGKSANRGECLQPCRREYTITNTEEEQAFALGEHHVMSPKDLCTLAFIDQLLVAGIASFKIEGRNRSPEYVATVTSAYRHVVDFCHAHSSDPGFDQAFAQLTQEKMDDVARVYNRGFSAGFYMGRPLDAWTKGSGSEATTRKHHVGIVTNYYSRPGVAEVLVQAEEISLGDSIIFQGPTTGVIEQTVESMEIEHMPVDSAAKGQSIAIKTHQAVRRSDKLYVVRNS